MSNFIFDAGQTILNATFLMDIPLIASIDNSSLQFWCIIKEKHYRALPGGRYLCNFTPDLTKRKYAKLLLIILWICLQKISINKNFQDIGSDAINVNAGWEGRIIDWVEVKMNCKFISLFNTLHENEVFCCIWLHSCMEKLCLITV